MRTHRRSGGRWGATCWYALLVLVISVVNDGWSGRPVGWRHQVLLLPFTMFAVLALVRLLMLSRDRSDAEAQGVALAGKHSLTLLLICFESLSVAGFAYAARHFARFGYRVEPDHALVALSVFLVTGLWAISRRTALAVLYAVMAAYSAGLWLAITSFPLNYLRSDMLPVIQWADLRVVHHLSPYATMHIGTRLYDFPYLPGMLLAYLPAIALHLDVRVVNLVCVLLLSGWIYRLASTERRLESALLLGVFLLSPFLQYRHDLYLAPHWCAMVGAIALMQRRHYLWAAVAFGISMALYQLSWVIFPFFVLNAFRRRGFREAIKLGLCGIASMLVVMGPFLASAMGRIASNTVGQWSKLPHALADPINLSYWVTFAVRPDQLKWVQLAAMAGIFCYCFLRGRCATLTDTLRVDVSGPRAVHRAQCSGGWVLLSDFAPAPLVVHLSDHGSLAGARDGGRISSRRRQLGVPRHPPAPVELRGGCDGPEPA